ncbi:argonaute siRNA chaperone complex subunit Arb1 [Beauveria bassiana ARSEF 2860]|uniref:Argonaute siRNA chaperone complex subunit Arb1 n=1 Tax=Beauveria bassiana (strain ARSEF 2860) TaxID=655819 RepID=J4KM78_BEAB2|nr:argonaute siRNA chaperone complex subunit Arb1 [Beauveria bassiana ARSEF 2860]EJP63479.1 argonaute siRNA chaperone complex subunit Arb1 [Beauveria bassiana ARSEF 2860]
MDSDHEHDGLELDDAPYVHQKKKKKRAGRKKRRAITGFEGAFPAVCSLGVIHLTRSRILCRCAHNSRGGSPRIQTCIHRFRTRRNLNSELSTYFNEYMFLGGIDTYTAFSPEQLEDGALIPRGCEPTTHDDDDDAAANSRFYDGNARNWTVDFAAVAAGFLSVSVLPLAGVEAVPTERAIGVVENFLRYVLQHDVCPEHAANISEALRVCDRARDEWPRFWRLERLLPGRFTLAAAQTFGVHEEADWFLEGRNEEAGKAPTEVKPEVIFYASLVAAGVRVPKTESGRSALTVSRQFTCSLTLRSIEMPDDDVSGYFERLALGAGADTMTRLKLQPLGRAVFRPAELQDGWVRQVPFEALPADEDVVFLLERDILEAMTVGTLMTAHVCELSSGLRFIKTIETVQPSFYTFLPQHLIKDYKPPRANDRPPPSIHDRAAAAEETQVERPQDEESEAEELSKE